MQRTPAQKVNESHRQPEGQQEQGGQPEQVDQHQQDVQAQEVQPETVGGHQVPDPGGQGPGDAAGAVPRRKEDGAGALGTGVGVDVAVTTASNTPKTGNSVDAKAGSGKVSGQEKKQKSVQEDRAREAIKKLEASHQELLADSKTVLQRPSSYYASTIEDQAETLLQIIKELIAHNTTVKGEMWKRGIRGQPIILVERKQTELKKGFKVVDRMREAAKVVAMEEAKRQSQMDRQEEELERRRRDQESQQEKEHQLQHNWQDQHRRELGTVRFRSSLREADKSNQTMESDQDQDSSIQSINRADGGEYNGQFPSKYDAAVARQTERHFPQDPLSGANAGEDHEESDNDFGFRHQVSARMSSGSSRTHQVGGWGGYGGVSAVSKAQQTTTTYAARGSLPSHMVGQGRQAATTSAGHHSYYTTSGVWSGQTQMTEPRVAQSLLPSTSSFQQQSSQPLLQPYHPLAAPPQSMQQPMSQATTQSMPQSVTQQQFYGQPPLSQQQFNGQPPLGQQQFYGQPPLGQQQFHGQPPLSQQQFYGQQQLPQQQYHGQHTMPQQTQYHQQNFGPTAHYPQQAQFGAGQFGLQGQPLLQNREAPPAFYLSLPPPWNLVPAIAAAPNEDVLKSISKGRLIVFSGAKAEYDSWREKFIQCIHLKQSSPAAKALALQASLDTKHPKLRLIANSITLSDEGYRDVIVDLEEDYGGGQRLRQERLKQVLEINCVRVGDLNLLFEYELGLKGYVSAVDQTGNPDGVEQEDETFLMVAGKLDQQLGMRFCDWLRFQQRLPNIRNLLSFVKEEVTQIGRAHV